MDGYVDTAEVIDRFPGLAGHEESDLIAAIVSTAEDIDNLAGRTFNLSTASARLFTVCDTYLVKLGRNEIGGSAGVVVKTDDGSGAFATTIAASGYSLEPVNALAYGRPFTAIRRLGAMWPYATTSNSRQERLQITAPWGWPTIPEGVREASLVLINARLTNPGAVQSESYDDYRVVYGTIAVRTARRLLARLQRPLVA